MSKALTLKRSYLPGDFAIWIVIYVELLTFGLFFVGYAFSRRLNVQMFNDSQLFLNKTAGFIDTLILITSSYFIVKAIQRIKNSKENDIHISSDVASKWLLATMVFGGIFLINKLLEFSAIFSQGFSLSTNTFFMFYLLLTMFHFMHVLLGTIIIFTIRQKVKILGYSSTDYTGMETGAVYWHLVDLLWIVLFALIYIMR
ncbi:cytochrome c oxidase subunit 3 [Sulfuricurvum sp.]|uniref:cytochrome c oxidase subunit 3 n=1 Tax=Sulfuricurvum sp. TaxID=2025608 RepID=UPI002614D1F1|nr:cytochrome c oxidase subunit 3 [Sulfuricurvum sp.]MDD2266788.1 cytochrome c oxidase subunit 3 [Sulfuricurvum sp.]